jgi:hypothetical protein
MLKKNRTYCAKPPALNGLKGTPVLPRKYALQCSWFINSSQAAPSWERNPFHSRVVREPADLFTSSLVDQPAR